MDVQALRNLAMQVPDQVLRLIKQSKDRERIVIAVAFASRQVEEALYAGNPPSYDALEIFSEELIGRVDRILCDDQLNLRIALNRAGGHDCPVEDAEQFWHITECQYCRNKIDELTAALEGYIR